ncbi:5'/3'-nucleotidase SurE [Ningiella sp. W23]|uniref:5'/3'-nucleotidase SurE n=1 Tax=Ningiella sp. W23 TaxID=3023715 RepID=UPI003757240B
MRILLSNDDGVFAPGIACMYDYLSEHFDVTVIAPDRNCSGMSNALSLHQPLRVQKADNGFYSVNGTPSDCVQLGINGGFIDIPDLVVSGINDGPNLGDDTIYSGTVAAALEGRHLGHPAIAISLCCDKSSPKQNLHFETAASITVDLIKNLDAHPLDATQILNVNVPNIPKSKVKGILATRCGKRHKAETMFEDKDPFGRRIFWYGRIGEGADAGEGTDFSAVNSDYCSVTPLSTDMTVHQQLNKINDWLKE